MALHRHLGVPILNKTLFSRLSRPKKAIFSFGQKYISQYPPVYYHHSKEINPSSKIPYYSTAAASALAKLKPNSLEFAHESRTAVTINPEHILKSSLQHVQIPDVNLDEYVWADAGKWSGKIAMECALTGRNYTYGQCRIMTRRFASALIKSGLKPGDVIALVLPNIPEFPIVFLGANAAGVACTLINPQYTADEVTKQMTECDVKAVVTISLFVPMIQAAQGKVPTLKSIIVVGDAEDGCHSFKDMVKDDGSAFPTERPVNRSRDLAVLPYSSGTTGKPKGVMLSHYNLIANIRSCIQPDWCNFRHTTSDSQEVFIAVLPFFHILSLNAILMGGLSLGAKIICLPSFEPNTFIKALEDHRPTFLHTVPRLMDYIATSKDIKTKYLERVHAVVCGGSPAGKKIIEKMMNRMHPTEIKYQEGYGMTESSPVICMLQSSYSSDKLGSCGTLVPMTEAVVIDNETKQSVGPSKIGELYCRGPQVMQGYWKNEVATQESFDGDWLKTGDVVYHDNDSHFHIVDRKKEMIKVKGFQVAPSEIEEILMEMPGLVDAAVIGIPDKASGELPKAYVVKSSNIDSKDVHEYLKIRLAPYKQLRGGIEFIEAIPRNPSGKILKRELRVAAGL